MSPETDGIELPMQDDLRERYFNWIYERVIGPRYPYRKLLHRLFEIPFVYILEMDANRKEDGLSLRYRFGYEKGIPDSVIANQLDITECSVLEMMAALAIHCEEDIMDDPAYGDRTSKWFMSMINSLGLSGMDDRRYSQNYVDAHIDIFLHRRYEPDGRGGLFHLEHCTDDLRNVQIWYQMNWYLNELADR